MILETVTILYYSLATISIGIVLYQKYNKQIHTYINKWLYNYESVPNEEHDLNLSNNLNDDTYILFSDENNNDNQSNNNDYQNNNTDELNNNTDELNNNTDELNNIENNNNEINNNENNNNLKLKTKKNILIEFV